MSIITVEFDNILEKSEIVMPLISSSKAEAGDDYNGTNMTDKAQTAVFGIQVPLIMINHTVIDFDAVHHFSLKSQGCLPELSMTIEDKFELLTNIDKPTNDNEVRIQILPRFDNAYKKVNLTFYINNIQVSGSLVRLTCSYKLPALMSSQFKTLGEMDTYSIFKKTAADTGLGFATNIAQGNDFRYVYCNNLSYYDLLNDEIQFADATDHIMDWWIDLWDNINLVDIRERYNSVDSDDDIQIWVAGQVNEVTIDNETKPYKTPAVLSNFPGLKQSELFVKSYSISNKPGVQISKGSDKVYGVYEDNKNEYIDYLIQDGDTKSDIFTVYDYLGENYGEYNYMLAKQLRSAFMQKINAETIIVKLQSPLLGIMRGHKVNFIRYVNDDKIENKMKNLEEAGVIDRNVETNIPLNNYELPTNTDNGSFRIDRTASGQYLVIGVDITYSNKSWDYTLTLSKPASSRTNIVNN